MIINHENIKPLLEYIIDDALTYYEEETIEKIKDFEINLFPTEFIEKNVAGKYLYKKKQLWVFNTDKFNNEYILRTALHELAHHINYVVLGNLKHNEFFFADFSVLLHSALDFGLIKPFRLADDNITADRNEVKKILNNWKENNRSEEIRLLMPEYFVDEDEVFIKEPDFDEIVGTPLF